MIGKRTIAVISVVMILVASIAAYAVITISGKDNGDNGTDDAVSGLTGTYLYMTYGTYNDDSMQYMGTWRMELDNGEVIKNEGSLSTYHETSYPIVNVGTELPVSDRPDGYIDHIPEKNEVLAGAEYLGDIIIETSNFGSISTSVYESGDKTYYADDSGAIYRIVLTTEFGWTEIQVVYELRQIAS
ncbi:MAG: hypothetical protein KRP56_03745 [Candidatus Methanogranum gryphiswaldense]|nr:MAG: hypothetical protein KRP56_03745 [Candidatus Methanogranum sp. U3.2.1]